MLSVLGGAAVPLLNAPRMRVPVKEALPSQGDVIMGSVLLALLVRGYSTQVNLAGGRLSPVNLSFSWYT